MTRERLPNRRQCDNITFSHDGMRGIVSFARYDAPMDDGDIAEIFIDIGKPGSGLKAATQAAAIAASLALQRGTPFEEIRGALPRLEDGRPAEPLGAAMDAILSIPNPQPGEQ